jgi:hypothetical protein
VRDEFAKLGWEAWSADILLSESPDSGVQGRGSARHYKGDVLDLFSWDHPVNGSRDRYRRLDNDGADAPLWDLVIAFPPCTHLSLAGAVWWKKKREPRGYWDDGLDKWIEIPSLQDEAAGFFMEMIGAPAPYVAVENPRGDMTRRYRAPDQYVQPHMFGDPLIKATGLWLKGLPLLVADNPVEPAGRVATGGGSWRTDRDNPKEGWEPSNRHEDGKGRKFRQRERNRTLPGLARAMAQQWSAFIEEQEKTA